MNWGAIIDTELGSYTVWFWRLRIEYKRYTRMGHGPQVTWARR